MAASISGKHGIADLAPEVRLHYVEAGEGSRTLVLLHGYPQTWWEWRHVIPAFVQAGFRVIAPDYRGAGGSSKPPDGYDKQTMAADIEMLLRQHLGVEKPVVLAGHDIGMMVAYAFAASFPKSVERLVLMEAPIPGTLTYSTMIAATHLSNFMAWHFFFHNASNNLAELLTQGRERQYLKHFYDRLAFNPDAIGAEDLHLYASQFEAAGAMRAGFELYRAFDKDADDNRAALKKNGRLLMPVLGLGGASSFFIPIAKPMLKEVAKDATIESIPHCGHWVAEEAPEAFIEHVLAFCNQR